MRHPWRRFQAWRVQRHNRPVIDRIFASIKTVVVSVVLIAVVTVGMVLYFRARDRDRDVTQHAQDEQARIERSVENCHNVNVDQTSRRSHDAALIGEIGRDFFNLTVAQADAIAANVLPGSPFYQFTVAQFPYRDCSVACVVAQTDPDIPNCPPAPTEAG